MKPELYHYHFVNIHGTRSPDGSLTVSDWLNDFHLYTTDFLSLAQFQINRNLFNPKAAGGEGVNLTRPIHPPPSPPVVFRKVHLLNKV